ncbi:DUF4232 domain-containing protein [Streptomyces sp. NPDC086787]|uniref:DUF4232 domain-containing protein n=1 Tax=Streptomyces sp. NPDC086787 TaxID=3365759 RepID=UPI00381A99E5
MNIFRIRAAIATVGLASGLGLCLTAFYDNDKAGAASGSASASASGSASGLGSACTDADTEVRVSRVASPVDHLLLTVTNTGSGGCTAYGAPGLRFDDGQEVVPCIEDSRPQSAVSLAAGQSAYAALRLTGDPGNGVGGFTASQLSVLFATQDLNGSVGAPVTVALPAETFTDSGAAVTYWQSDRQDALRF